MKEWNLNKFKKAELIQMIHQLEKENHKLVDDYNTMQYLLDKDTERYKFTLYSFINDLTRITKFNYKNGDTINIPQLTRHIKKAVKRWK